MVESNYHIDDISSFLGVVKANILHELSYSEKNMGELSEILKINKTAVKEHMESLELKGYVKSFFRGEGAGRPSKYYELTEKGLELFPKKYIMLSSLLVKEMESEFGVDKVNELLAKVADKMVTNAGWKREDNEENLSREEKINRLRDFVSALNRLGYYARLEVSDDVVRIIRHNCIFYELAKTNNKIICGTLGTQIITQSIDKDFEIKEKFSEGAKKCVVEVNLD